MILVAAVMVPRAEAQADKKATADGGSLFEKPGDLDQVLAVLQRNKRKKSQTRSDCGVDLSQTTVELFDFNLPPGFDQPKRS